MRPLVLFVSALLLFGCDDTRLSLRDTGPGGGDGGPAPDTGIRFDFDAGPPRDAGPPGTNDCSTAAEQFIYLVDSEDVFLRFDPSTNGLTVLGTLSCPTSASPFSMSVDRDATAWVLYNDGRIYNVLTEGGLACSASAFTPNQQGFDVFGMGFVADAAGEDAETLFISGGAESDVLLGSADLGFVARPGLTVNAVGSLPGWPELTGTGDAELWGFFPDTFPPSVRRIDKGSASTPEVFDLNTLPVGTSGDRAWAFAFWGGRFFIFYKNSSDASTNIYRLDPNTEELLEVVNDTGYRIVGAGVSTCAPVILI